MWWLWGALCFWICGVKAAPLTIDITKGVVANIPLAFPGFEGENEIASIVANDLQLSGVFDILKAKGPQTPREAFARPELWPWQSYEGAVLVSGIASQSGDDITLIFRLYDVTTGKLLGEAEIKGTNSQKRVLAHKVSNAIYERLTGEPGYFDTHIVYTAQYGPATNKTRRIARIDCDGENCQFLTPEKYRAFTPQCSPTQPLVAFATIENFRNRMRIMDLRTGQTTILPLEGIHISPRFSPDGSKLIFCAAKKGTTTIYSYDLTSKQVQQLTHTEGRIDVSPTFSPDGSKIIFSSDRQGRKPKLYSLDLKGGEPRLITPGPGSYLCPTWSPDGKWIAFVKRINGMFYLGVMDPEGNQERMLAADHVIDYPSWAPSSRVIIFAAQQRYYGPFQLYFVDFTGRALRPLKTHYQGSAHEGNHPSWQQYKDH